MDCFPAIRFDSLAVIPVTRAPDIVYRLFGKAGLERFRAKARPGLDPGWIPVRVKKARQNKNLESRSDSIGTEKALDAGHFTDEKEVGTSN
jgi:hypothetical protein